MNGANGFVKVAAAADIPAGTALKVEVNGTPVAVFNVEGRLFAIGDTCSHEEASLSEGEVIDIEVECPRHGAMFDLATGVPQTLPATRPVPVYEVKVEGDSIWLRPQVGVTK